MRRPSLLLLFMCLILSDVTSLSFGESVETNSVESSVLLKRTYAPEDLVERSTLCLSPKMEASTGVVLQQNKKMVDALTSKRLLEVYESLEQQVVLYRHLGFPSLMSDKSGLQEQIQKTLRACSQTPTQIQFSGSLENLLVLARRETVEMNASQADFLKRYLFAVVERQRLQYLLDSGEIKDSAQKQSLAKRIEKITNIYPAARKPYLFPGDFARFVPSANRLTTSRGDYAHYEEFLFGDKPLSDLSMADGSRTDMGKFAQALLAQELPIYLKDSFHRLLKMQLRAPLKAVAQLCRLDSCDIYGMDKKATSSYLNATTALGQRIGERTVCECELKGNNPTFLPQLTETLAWGALGAGAGCLFLPQVCLGAAVAGIATGVAGTGEALHQGETFLQMKKYEDLFKNLPTQSRDQYDQIRSQNQESLKALATQAALAFGGGKLADVALKRFINKVSRPRRQTEPRTFQAGTTIVEQWDGKTLRRSQAEDGKYQYALISGNRTEFLRMDVTGYAVVATNEKGRRLARTILGSGEQSVIMIDVNNLGLINYFEGGTKAGDDYLESVAKVISESLEGSGIPFRWGGDEFVVSLGSTDPTFIQQIQQSIIDGVATNKKANTVFSKERQARAKQFKAVQSAENYNALPENFKNSLSEEEKIFAQESSERFAEFLQFHKAIETKALEDLAALNPSVSIGSSVIASRKTVDVALQEAEENAAKSKIIFKTERGQDVSKYTGRPSYIPTSSTVEGARRSLRGRPPNLPPTE